MTFLASDSSRFLGPASDDAVYEASALVSGREGLSSLGVTGGRRAEPMEEDLQSIDESIFGEGDAADCR